MPKQPAQRADAADRDAAGPDGWHALAVANPTFLLERLGSECTDIQGVRELTVNGLDAIAALGAPARGRVVWDLDWERFDAPGGRARKLPVTDTGTGMTSEQLRQYINQLASSGREEPGGLQHVHGERHHLERRAVAGGVVELSDALARWWVLDDDHRARPREGTL